MVTGATAGFGEACARLFASHGDNLIITGRREERLQKLARELSESHNIKVVSLVFDVRVLDQVNEAISALEGEWKNIDILVNNAGLASGFDKIQEGNIDDWDKMIDTNVKGLLYVSKAIIPGMIKRKSGHVINIGSTASKEVYAKGNVYCASKHAVEAISKGMRIDLLGTGVKVTQVSPGAADTEFSEVRFHGDKNKAKDVYKGYKPMTGRDIAEMVSFVSNLPPHLNINDLVVTSLAQANSFYIERSSD